MTEQDILDLIAQDEWMMSILHTAEKLNLPNWVIGAGFVRNKVWDNLYGYTKKGVETNDIDLVYYDLEESDLETDEALSERLKAETGIDWEIVNQARAYKWNNLPQYKSIEDALAHWPETATAIGVRLNMGELELITPYGIEDLVNLVIKPSPKFPDGAERVQERISEKGWLKKWPNLKVSL